MKKYPLIVATAAATAMLWMPSAEAGNGGTISVNIGDAEVTEGSDTTATVAITLSSPAPVGGFCVEVSQGGAGDTAEPTADYLFSQIQFSFPQGATGGNANITIVDDEELEFTETFEVKSVQIACGVAELGVLPGINAVTTIDTSDTGTVTIIDDDEGPLTGSGSRLLLVGASTLLAGLVGFALSRSGRRTRTA